MAMQRETPLAVAAGGLLAGTGGAVAVTALATLGRRLLAGPDRTAAAHAADGITAGEALSEGPELPPNMNRVTATFVQKLATGIFGVSLSPEQQYVAGTAWHLAYGGFWGAIYALLRSGVPVPGAVLGPLHGLGVWALGFAWLVPRMGLALPPGQQRTRTTAVVLGIHLAYGTLVALGTHLLGRRG